MTMAEAGLIQARATFLSTTGKIGRLAMPLMLGSLTAAGLGIAKAAILAHKQDAAALYTLSMVQPAFIVMLAFLESLAVTNQVFSAKSYRNWPRGDIRRSTRLLSWTGLVLTALVSAAAYGASSLAQADSLIAPVLPEMAVFATSLAPYLLFELRNAALRGQGKTSLALVPFAVLVVADLAATWTCVQHFELGFKAILIGNVTGPLVALPLVHYFLKRELGDATPSQDGSFRKRLIGLIIGVATPTFLSTFAGSIAAMVIFPMLAQFGQEIVSGFLIVIRMRILFIIPAIATGSAIAILINHMDENGRGREKKSILVHGVTTVSLVYLLATACLYLARTPAVDAVVSSSNVVLHQATLSLVAPLILTFFLVGAATMLQVILEHLGLGLAVLVTTVAMEAATISFALLTLHRGAGLSGLLIVMNGTAALSLLIYFIAFMFLVKKTGRHDAV